MATSAGQRIKAFLAAGELAMKTANALDEHYAEFATLEVRLQDLRNERTSEEERLAEIRDEIVRTGAALHQAQQQAAAQTNKIDQELGHLRDQQRTADQKLKETQSQVANVLAGLRALKERIGAE